ncbi:DUF2300 domain-containing protein [Massilia sp. W12]|uniref:DUF2300 domain-containing protein n=1 Tax=Massilia sp. W12 TaxID=3126507 RepID=UPI0030D37F5E
MAAAPSARLAAPPALLIMQSPDGAQSYWELRKQEAREAGPATQDYWRQAPLGSLWKIFSYLYLQQQKIAENPYQCQGRDLEQEAYCCESGQSIQRQAALARSCGLYFEPARWQITAQDWRQFWQQALADAPHWLLTLPAKRGLQQAALNISPEELLRLMAKLPPAWRDDLRQGLLDVSLHGTARELLPVSGSAPRLKTWTWRDPQDKHRRISGAMGFLPDGSLFWLGGPGSSQHFLPAYSAAFTQVWQQAMRLPEIRHSASYKGEECVDVHFYKRYPLRQVLQRKDGAWRAAASGPLQGEYQLHFEHGKQLQIRLESPLHLLQKQGRWQIHGRMALNDYVARVVEREGQGAQAGQAAAAYALAVAARSYLWQNGQFHGGCRSIADDTRHQRVLAARPAHAALQAAWFTDGLLLDGAAVQYHLDAARPGVMSWRLAQQQARAGWDFTRILRHVWPQAQLASVHGAKACERLSQSEAWLAQKLPRWRSRLQTETGFEDLPAAPHICLLDYGNPYSDQRSMRMYVRSGQGLEDKLNIAHEYLHLAFKRHPRGVDEAWLEHKARELVEGL